MLYKTEDGGKTFISAADAQRAKLVMAYYPTMTEAEQAGSAASTRKGRISALSAKLRPEVPTGQISWIVGNKHVGEHDSELCRRYGGQGETRGCGRSGHGGADRRLCPSLPPCQSGACRSFQPVGSGHATPAPQHRGLRYAVRHGWKLHGSIVRLRAQYLGLPIPPSCSLLRLRSSYCTLFAFFRLARG